MQQNGVFSNGDAPCKEYLHTEQYNTHTPPLSSRAIYLSAVCHLFKFDWALRSDCSKIPISY